MNYRRLWGVLLILSCFCQITWSNLQGKCSKCLTNGVACLDEHTFAMCYHGTMTNESLKCATGSVCTDGKIICVAELDGRRPICAEDYCDNCAPTQGRFACVNQTSYGFCFGAMTHDAKTVRHCPEGMVCTLQGGAICASSLNTRPTCISQIDDDIEPTAETTTDDTTASSAGATQTTMGTTSGDTTEATQGTDRTTPDSETTSRSSEGDTTTNTEDTTPIIEGTTLTTSLTTETTEDTSETTKDTEITSDNTTPTTKETTEISEETTHTTGTADSSETTKDTEVTNENTTPNTKDTTSSIETSSSTTEDVTPTSETSMVTTPGTKDTTEVTTVTTQTTSMDTTAMSSETTANSEITTLTSEGTTGTTSSETLPTSPETLTTEKAPQNAFTFCSNKKTQGFFKDEFDPSCKNYFYCYLLAGQYLGHVYKCSGYFNGVTQRCQEKIPADCESRLKN